MEDEEITPTCIKALPYTYDEEDERCVSILDVIVDFCGEELPKEDEGEDKILAAKKSLWAKIWQTIRFLSSLTCWTDGVDDTFITQCRTQTYHARQVNACSRHCCRCGEDDIVIPLAYTPLDEDMPFVDAVMAVSINGKIEKTHIPVEYLQEHYDEYTNELHILRDDFPDQLLARGACCCLCERNLTINLKYNAGYDSIPSALLPMMCPLLAKIDDSKMSINDCAVAMTQVSGLLKSKKVGNVQYTWSDKDSEIAKTQALYTELYNLANVAEVFAISRCDIVFGEESAGDVI